MGLTSVLGQVVLDTVVWTLPGTDACFTLKISQLHFQKGGGMDDLERILFLVCNAERYDVKHWCIKTYRPLDSYLHIVFHFEAQDQSYQSNSQREQKQRDKPESARNPIYKINGN